jgi:hypothetical protein
VTRSKPCTNPTCSVPTTTTYCSRRCQLAMRNRRVGWVSLPDIWIERDAERELVRLATIRNLDLADLVASMVDEYIERGGSFT